MPCLKGLLRRLRSEADTVVAHLDEEVRATPVRHPDVDVAGFGVLRRIRQELAQDGHDRDVVDADRARIDVDARGEPSPLARPADELVHRGRQARVVEHVRIEVEDLPSQLLERGAEKAAPTRAGTMNPTETSISVVVSWSWSAEG